MRHIRIFLLTALLVLGFSVPVQAASYTNGIDVSAYNGKVDWAQVKKQGRKFVMIKTGEGRYNGTDDSDKQFAANYSGAGKAGLKRGVYHIACRASVAEAKKEAQYCLKILGGRKLEYPVAYDIENKQIFATGKTNVTNMAKAFCDIIKKAGYTPMIYSSSYYLNTYFNWTKLKGIKVWVAEYGVSKPSFHGTYHIWQYSETGNVSGANTDKGLCDLNHSYLEAKKITLSAKTKTLGVRKTYTLKASVTPKQSWNKVKYTSSNSKVATVSAKGVITGKKAGKATITVKAGTVKAVCKVTVKVPDKVKLPKKSISLRCGKTYNIKPKIANGAYCYKYTYSSSSKSVATVSSGGRIKAVKKGRATITVKTFNGKTAKLTVNVKA